MNFAYNARTRSGDQSSGSIDAHSRSDAMSKLEHMGLVPVSIAEVLPVPSTQSPAGTAIASLILSILGVSLPAVICGHVGLVKIRKSAGALSGTGLAVAGLIIGYLGLAVQLFFVGVFALGVLANANFDRKAEEARRHSAEATLAAIATCMEIYQLDVGQYPSDILSLIVNRERSSRWSGPYLKATSEPLDPWGRPYELRFSSSNSFELISLGPDGRRGTKDDIGPYPKR